MRTIDSDCYDSRMFATTYHCSTTSEQHTNSKNGSGSVKSRCVVAGSGLLQGISGEELSALARRVVESDEPAEVEKLKCALTQGFYGT